MDQTIVKNLNFQGTFSAKQLRDVTIKDLIIESVYLGSVEGSVKSYIEKITEKVKSIDSGIKFDEILIGYNSDDEISSIQYRFVGEPVLRYKFFYTYTDDLIETIIIKDWAEAITLQTITFVYDNGLVIQILKS